MFTPRPLRPYDARRKMEVPENPSREVGIQPVSLQDISRKRTSVTEHQKGITI